MFATTDRPEPWRRGHVLASLVLASLGVTGMISCWYLGADELTYDDQVPWLIGSIVSAGVVVLAGVVWLICAFREVAILQRDVLRCLKPWLAACGTAEPAADRGGPVTALLTAPRMNRAHRPGCLMVRGKTGLQPVTASEAADRGLTRCGACGS